MWWLPLLVVLAIIGATYAAAVMLLIVGAVTNHLRTRRRDRWVRVDLTPRDMPREEKH